MAMLEEALVPMYFFHRYQVEAASKIIGGLNYRYALRGDEQPVTELVPAAVQLKALDALLSTVSPTALALPENLIKIIPPRPIGYQRSREVILTRTDLTFDPIAAAESASDMTFSMILHPARVTRLTQQSAIFSQQPSLESILDKLIANTFKTAPKVGYEAQLQMTVNHALLNNLIKLTMNTSASSQARAVALLKIDQLKFWLMEKSRTATSESWKAHYGFELETINSFKSNPLEYKAENFLPAPPGQPIGQDEDYCNWSANNH